MPSRNRLAKACEHASFSPNETAPLTDFSGIVHASRNTRIFVEFFLRQPLARQQALRRRKRLSSVRLEKLKTWLPRYRNTDGKTAAGRRSSVARPPSAQ